MNENVKLKCQVLETQGDNIRVQSQLVDGTNFEIWASVHETEMIEETNNCWLNCVYSGESNKVAVITLPKPSIQFGSKITVPAANVRRHLFEGAKTPKVYRPITIPNEELGKVDMMKLMPKKRRKQA